MAGEYEVVSHDRLSHINAFLVRMAERAPHLHADLELGLVLSGRVALRTGSGSYSLGGGEIYLVNPMEAHEFAAGGDGALLLALQLSPGLAEPVFPAAASIRFPCGPVLTDSFRASPRQGLFLSALCVELARAYLRRGDGYELMCLSLAAALLRLLRAVLGWELISREDYLPMKQRTDRVLSITDYIERNFRRKLLLGELAEREGLSLSYLSHFFRDTLGMTFQKYLSQKRLEYACRLLATTDRNILDISLSSGFSDVRYFNRSFQEQFGCSPGDYRGGRAGPSAPRRLPGGASQYFFAPDDALRLIEPVHRGLLDKLKNVPLSAFLGALEE